MFEDKITRKQRLGKEDYNFLQAFLIITVLFAILVVVANISLDRTQKYECEKLAQHQEKYPTSFYYTQAEWDNCNK